MATSASSGASAVREMVVNGVRLHVEEEGSGPEAIVFSHGMLRTSRMFDPQVAVLRDRYRCIRYDHRGQGASESPQDAVIDLETVYDDAVALIEALDIAPCHWVGLSMDGVVGIRLAARRPDLLGSVSRIETSAERDEPLVALRGRASRLEAGGQGSRRTDYEAVLWTDLPA